jgi:hypothetical protein
LGGYVRPANEKENRRDRRLAVNQTVNRRVVVIAREKNGKILPFVFKTDGASFETVGKIIEVGSTVDDDELGQNADDARSRRIRLTSAGEETWAHADPDRGVLRSRAAGFSTRPKAPT